MVDEYHTNDPLEFVTVRGPVLFDRMKQSWAWTVTRSAMPGKPETSAQVLQCAHVESRENIQHNQHDGNDEVRTDEVRNERLADK